VVTVPPTTIGAVVAGLAAVHSCFSSVGTCLAGVGLGAGEAAGRLTVARASLVHQISAATAATASAIAAAATMSPVVRRSGRTIRDRGSVRVRGEFCSAVLGVSKVAATTATTAPGRARVARSGTGRRLGRGFDVAATGGGVPGGRLAATRAPAPRAAAGAWLGAVAGLLGAGAATLDRRLACRADRAAGLGRDGQFGVEVRRIRVGLGRIG